MPHRKLGFIGAGAMAEAIARAVLNAGRFPADAILAADINEERRALFRDEIGVNVTHAAIDVARDCDIIVLAVKPQQLPDVLSAIGPVVRPDQLIISIAAGAPLRRIEDACSAQARVIRVMPNTPMLVGQGMSALCRGRFATAEDLQTAADLCGCAGDTVIVEEKDMDAVTAVSGSGPAYFFYLVEKMVEAGVAEGLDPDIADKLARQTALGAARLLTASDESPAELRRRVTSPGGTTEAAMRLLTERGGGDAWLAAIRGAAERSRELGAD